MSSVPNPTITSTIHLAYDACSFWIFQSIGCTDYSYPEQWKPISRFCRWWIFPSEAVHNAHDVYGVLQLTKPLSSRGITKFTVFHQLGLDLIPATLRLQQSYLPPSADGGEIILKEFGIQTLPKVSSVVVPSTPAPSDKKTISEFFANAPKKKKKKATLPSKKRKHTSDSSDTEPWLPGFEPNGSTDEPDYPLTQPDPDDESQLY